MSLTWLHRNLKLGIVYALLVNCYKSQEHVAFYNNDHETLYCHNCKNPPVKRKPRYKKTCLWSFRLGPTDATQLNELGTMENIVFILLVVF